MPDDNRERSKFRDHNHRAALCKECTYARLREDCAYVCGLWRIPSSRAEPIVDKVAKLFAATGDLQRAVDYADVLIDQARKEEHNVQG